MAKVTLNPMIELLSGKIGDVVFRVSATGKQIIAKRPDMSKVKWSKAQKEHRQRFQKAIAYAKAAMADEKVRHSYEKAAAKQGKRPFDLAVSDYLKDINLLSAKIR